MKIIKYSRISPINIGDVFISDAISYANAQTLAFLLESQDILFEEFKVDERIKNAASTSSFYKVKKRNKFYSFVVLVIKIILFHLKDRKKIKKQIREYDTVFIGGGNIIAEFNGSDLFYRIQSIVKIAKEHRKFVVIYGVGLGPFEFKYKKRLAKLLNDSDYFSVRDNNSLSIINNLGYNLNKVCRLTIDPAFIISDMWPKEQIHEIRYIGLNFMNYSRIIKDSKFNVDDIVDNLVKIYHHYRIPFKIINTSFGEDLSLSLSIEEKLNTLNVPTHIYNITSLNSVASAYADLKFFLASRMHSSIFAMSYNIPTLIFSWHPKVEFLMEMLFSENKVKVLLNSENFDPVEITDKIKYYEQFIDLKVVMEVNKSNIYNNYKEVFDVFK